MLCWCTRESRETPFHLAVFLAFVNAYSSKGVVRVAEALSTMKFLALCFIILVGLSKLFTGSLQVFAAHFATGYSVDAGTVFVALYAANWAYEGW